MYTTPHPRVEVGLRVRVDGAEQRLATAGSLRRELRAYARRRTSLGSLTDDASFARGLLELNPSWEAITLELTHWQLDRGSARWTTRREELRFER
jgi:hypothetical protein